MTRWFIVICHRRIHSGRTDSLMGCETEVTERRGCAPESLFKRLTPEASTIWQNRDRNVLGLS